MFTEIAKRRDNADLLAMTDAKLDPKESVSRSGHFGGVKVSWMRLAQVLLDTGLIALSFIGAFLIRFDGRLIGIHQGYLYLHELFILLPILVSGRLVANWQCGVYRRLWRYTGLTEMMEIGFAVLSVTTILVIVRALGGLAIEGHQLSYGIIMIDAGLCVLLLAFPRILRRLQTEHLQRRHWRQPVRRRALLVGAGDAGMLVLKELSQRPDLGVDIIGVLDDDPTKLKKRLGKLTVFGTTHDLPTLVENLFIDQVIIAIPSAPAADVRRIADLCRAAEVETRILPGLFELINGKVSVNQLREVSLEDLLGREPVKLDSASIANYVSGRCVLVTGAGGSIGGELCRQIMRFEPATLLLLGRGENSIFSIHNELQERNQSIKLVPVIADIRDQQRMFHIFNNYKPQVVFHAAAHKHVPLMEGNVTEAVTNNVKGTKNLAELSAQFNAETFVLVSSDKAVNPTSVMGASKRMAELIVQDIARRSSTKYVAVRFGNVLASRGSVIPMWKQQIAAGGPVTVTHPDATRYFMLIPEAVQLIIQAGALGQGGEIFVLDMGNPVKILDLAKDLIKFSGLRLGSDIEIAFVGLRPGEKLFEELLTAEEGLSKTLYDKIFVGKPQVLEENILEKALITLFSSAELDDDEKIRMTMHELVGGTLLTVS